ncbi:MAG: PorV/PorQ family protein [Bacteroidota bacterium]|jgi:long-subunit fatty acid transport protein|nr:PorV/PorQ family protein [Bacteroidota bacterium]
MTRLLRPILPLLVLLGLTVPQTLRAQLVPLLGGQRAGISSLQFLKIGGASRAAAMAESFIAVADDASALQYNPAGMVQFDGHEAIFTHTGWLVDLQHEFVGAVYRIDEDDAVGVSFTSLHTDDMEIRTETQPFGTGRYFSYGDIAVGLSFARRLTSQFSFGATVRYVEETIDVLKTRALMVDLGTYYWTGLGTTRFSVAVSNFGNNVSPEGTLDLPRGEARNTFQEFSPPTTFRIGFAFEPIEDETNRLTTSIQLNHPNDNSENVAVGVEYAWNSLFFVRAGYKLNVDEEGLTAGAGINAPLSVARLGVDYAFADFDRLGAVHRITVRLGL